MARTIILIILVVPFLIPLRDACGQKEREIVIVEEKAGPVNDAPRTTEKRVEERRIIVRGTPEMEFRGPDFFHRERELEEMRNHDPEKYKLTTQIDELEHASHETSEKYHHAENAEEKARLESRLLGILDQLFDIKLELDELEQKRLEKEAAKLKERVSERKKNKEKIMELRMNELLGKDEHLRW